MKVEMDQAVVHPSEWIIQADLPPREVEFASDPGSARPRPARVANSSARERERRLQALFDFLRSILPETPILLRSAGAVSVTATHEQLAEISKHPLVKRIEPNRRLR